jgi:hypothetical protein
VVEILANNLPNNMFFYRYKISSIDLLFEGETEPTTINPNNVTDIYIEREYDEDYFPILKLSLVLDPKLYNKVIINKLTVKIRLKMQYYIYSDKDDFKFKTDLINDIFIIYLDEDTPFINENQYNQSKTIEGTDINPKDLSNDYTFYLFKESDINGTKKIINTILANINMTDSIVYLLNEGKISKVLMSPLHNKDKYGEVLIPPLTMLENLLYLEQQFGFYNNGALIFFDLDCTYILDNIATCTAFRTDEFKETDFLIKDTTNPDSITSGGLIDEEQKKYFINISPNNIKIKNESISSDQVIGNNSIIISPYRGDIQIIESGATQRGTGTYKLYVNKYFNKYSNNANKIRKSENSCIININITDFPIDAISPNKEFKFIFENTNINQTYGGSYRITRSILQFKKQGEEFIINGDCEFKKMIGSK